MNKNKQIKKTNVDPNNFNNLEIAEFKKNWGQSHTEICCCLEFPTKHSLSDELIINTGNYFWSKKDKLWLNKCASMFTPREQAIADYLRNEEQGY